MGLLVAFGPTGIQASAESTETASVHECDRLAAHPDDPERMARGVGSQEIVPRLARIACSKAVDSYPDDPRFLYQLGRALAAADQHEAALRAYRRAAEMGHGMAWYALGNSFERGMGTASDAAKAVEAYRKAATAGVSIADRAISGQVFTHEGYSDPALFRALYDSNWKGLDLGQDSLALYLFTFVLEYEQLEGCQAPFSRVAYGDLQKRAVLLDMYGGVFETLGLPGLERPELDPADLDPSRKWAALTDRANADAMLFHERHDCGSTVTRAFFGRLEELMEHWGTVLEAIRPDTARQRPPEPLPALPSPETGATPTGPRTPSSTPVAPSCETAPLAAAENVLLGRWALDEAASNTAARTAWASVEALEFRESEQWIWFPRSPRPGSVTADYASGCGFVWVTTPGRPPRGFRITGPGLLEVIEDEHPDRQAFFRRVR